MASRGLLSHQLRLIQLNYQGSTLAPPSFNSAMVFPSAGSSCVLSVTSHFSSYKALFSTLDITARREDVPCERGSYVRAMLSLVVFLFMCLGFMFTLSVGY